MKVIEHIGGWGHENITGKNRNTFEITTNDRLTKRGDCVLVVKSSKGASDLSDEFKNLAKNKDARITMILKAGMFSEKASGWGSPLLTLTHESDLVARKSDYICSRTLFIKSDKSAIDFSSNFIAALKNPKQEVKITLIVSV